MKAKYKILRIVLIFAVVLGLGSCEEEFLQTYPTDAVSTEIALGSVDNMMLAINGVHRQVYAQNGYISSYAGQHFAIATTAFGGDDALHSQYGNGWHNSRIKWLFHTDETRTDLSFVWFNYYNIIASCNNIINAAEGMTMSDDLHNILGQCYTYRAWGHFELVKYFGRGYLVGNPATDLGVPIMTATEPPYEGKERATVQAVYDQITSDLTDAIAHFADASPRTDLSHLNVDVANGVAARVYLTIGNWAMAASHANAARQNYTLMSEAQYKAGFGSWNNPEWIWASNVIQDQTTYYRSYFYFCSNNFNGSQNRSNPKFMNHLLYAQIADTDYRKDQILVNAPNTFDDWDAGDNAGRYATEDDFDDSVTFYRGVVNNSTAHNMIPYMHIKLYQDNGPTIDPRDVLHMRAAEMYLTEAEALARQGGQDAAAAAVLYDLISERDEAYVLSTNTGTDLIDEILLHRRIELFIEGHRWFDMIRNDEELDRTGTGADVDLYVDGFQQDRPSVNLSWVFKIPRREIDANPNIIQNEY